MTKEIQRTSVKGLFERDNKILLVKDQKGVWELPGGRIEHGESPEEALRRELNEELGWNQVNIENTIDSWSFTSKVGDIDYHFIILAYACNTKEDIIKKNDEYIEYKWMPAMEIDILNMRDGYKKTIKKFLSKG